MAQGDKKTGTKRTNSIFYIFRDEIDHMPEDWIVTYARIVVNFFPQKDDPNRVKITSGGNLIKKPGELTQVTTEQHT